MKKTLKEIADYLQADLEGDGDRVITGIAGIQDAIEGQLSFMGNDKYAALASRSSASALIVARNFPIQGFDLLRVDDPYEAWNRLLDLLKPEPIAFKPGIHAMAAVSDSAKVSREVTVMAHVTIEAGAEIGEGTRLYPGVYVGHESRIGKNCILYPNVVIRERIRVGDRVIIHGGAVLGSDGYGYEGTPGGLKKQEQYGIVVIEDDVEIGSNTTIDRARFDMTCIGRGTKIDNLVQIAHNVIVGENSMIVSQAGISGSARMGKNVILGGQVGVAGHVRVGDNVMAAAKSGITKSVDANRMLYGNPAGSHMEKKREMVGLRKIPGLLETVRALLKRVSRLEAQSKND